MNPVIHQLFQYNRYLTKQLNDVLAKHDLFHSQWTILFLLNKKGEMSLTSIWKYLNVEAPTVTRTVTRLEQMELVERKPGKDKREKIITLSPKAREQFPIIHQDILKFEENVISRLTKEEITQLELLLQKMKGD